MDYTCFVPGCDQNHVPNLPMLRKVIDHIQEEPESWNQQHWAVKWVKVGVERLRNARGQFTGQTRPAECGTAYCIAGHTVVMAGYDLEWEPGLVMGWGDAVLARRTSVTNPDTGWYVTISDMAAHELGLTRQEWSELFAGGNNLHDVLRACKKIAKRAGERF